MIDLTSTMKISLRALRANKMRSGLTMLGMIIGVGAVIVMLAIGSGAKKKIGDNISAIGSNLLIVVPGAVTSGGVRMSTGTRATLTQNDAEAIKNECPAVAEVAPVMLGGAQVVYGNQNWSTGITGTTPGYLAARDWGVIEGRAFSDDDVRNAARVALLGQTVATNLFGGTDPIGQMIRIRNVPFKVIGLLDKKGDTFGSQDQDDTVMVPLTAAQRNLLHVHFPGQVHVIMVKGKDLVSLPDAEMQIKELLKQRHHIGPNQDDDFTIRNLASMLQMAEEAASVMSLLLGVIASVSLVVGGIGIMNIMLVSVTERTREIGIRMAVGARTWDIRMQFLIEALTLAMIGGLVGILLGIAGAAIVSRAAEWNVNVSPFAVTLSFGVSAFIGLVFGFYPAWKASLLHPIDALRWE